MNTNKTDIATIDSKFNDFHISRVALIYVNGTTLSATVNVGTNFIDEAPVVSMVYRNQTPVNSTSILCSTIVDSSGNSIIRAYGSGYVNGHVLLVNVFCFKKQI